VSTRAPVHDVGKAGGGFRTASHVKGVSKGPVTKAVVIKVKNFGTVAESEVPYRVAGACVDANHSGTLDCVPGSISYSAACSGDAAAVHGGPILPGQVVSIPGCTVTYTAPTGGDKWVHTLVITHCGADGTMPPCTTNDGGTDAKNSNNTATRKTRVVP
jgi:hypothetical protein